MCFTITLIFFKLRSLTIKLKIIHTFNHAVYPSLPLEVRIPFSCCINQFITSSSFKSAFYFVIRLKFNLTYEKEGKFLSLV